MNKNAETVERVERKKKESCNLENKTAWYTMLY